LSVPATETRFSVVIPTYQRRRVVAMCLQALARQDGAPSFEVVVVVDGSTDGTAESLRSLELPFPLTVIEQPNRGRAAACNAGASAARGETLLFLDDDMEADPRLLAEHTEALDRGADVVIGHVPLHPEMRRGFLAAGVGQWAEARADRIENQGGTLELHDLLTGQMSISRALFLDVGGFDDAFTRRGTFGNEDLDLGHRLRMSGAAIVFSRKAVSFQRYVVTPRKYLRQWREAGQADVLFARKHPDLANEVFRPYARMTRADAHVWRALRVPLRETVLALSSRGLLRGRGVAWFYKVRNLEYFHGVGVAGGRPGRHPVRVVCYHAVADLSGAPVLESYGVPPKRFRRQLAVLHRLFRIVDAQEFAKFLDGASIPKRALLVTFDDCYRDLITDALPILSETQTPGLAFAVTQRLGGTNDWDRAIGAPELPLLDANELRAAEAGGIAIGSHTRTHRPLDRLDEHEIDDEIAGSFTDLDTLVGRGRERFLAYPHGAYDERAKTAAAAAGYAGAFTVDPGVVQPDCDRYALPRVEILAEDGWWRFLNKVART
jgi:glycosyltransferase involved in cell wall biosynthesis/peptidoglycan/xylan/chitin deacetylase (PgdA/CDA1 family)